AADSSTSALIGSPATIRERLRKFEESNVDQVILLNQAGKNTHEDICSSLEMFAKEVMPEFHDREPEHQAWKQKVLNREIELPEYDTSRYNVRSNQTPTNKTPMPTGA
ncbi:MAG: LLM class flavin-dependent oxidoreductase, partial [Tepidiformaceae bacterium]